MGAAVSCDGGCGKVLATTVATGNRKPGALPLVLPPGWAEVRYGDHAGVVCSHDCGAEWVLGLGVHELEATAGDPEAPPHEWSPETWIAFCGHHGVKQQAALQHAAALSKQLGGDHVGQFSKLAGLEDLAERVRQFVVAHSKQAAA